MKHRLAHWFWLNAVEIDSVLTEDGTAVFTVCVACGESRFLSWWK